MTEKEMIESAQVSYAIWYAYKNRGTDDGCKQFFDELLEDLRKEYPEWRVRLILVAQIAIGQDVAEKLKAHGLLEEKVG